MDITMPKLDGISAIKQLWNLIQRQDHRLRAMVCLAVIEALKSERRISCQAF